MSEDIPVCFPTAISSLMRGAYCKEYVRYYRSIGDVLFCSGNLPKDISSLSQPARRLEMVRCIVTMKLGNCKHMSA